MDGSQIIALLSNLQNKQELKQHSVDLILLQIIGYQVLDQQFTV